MNTQILRRIGVTFIVVGLATVLASCFQGNFPSKGGLKQGGQNSTANEVLGSGATRVALLVPISANGVAGDTGRALRNAAELALLDFPESGVQLMVKDTTARAEQAAAVAQQAIDERAQLILGPLFSFSVASVGVVSRQAGVPVIAYSTDSTVAGRGVYLLSFLPRQSIKEIIAFAAQRGSRSYAALIPQSTYGQLAEAAFREEVARNGGVVTQIARFDNSAAGQMAAAGTIIKAADQFDTLFIPDLGPDPAPMLQVLQAAGISPETRKFLGSGQWSDNSALHEGVLRGAFFPGLANVEFEKFATRYQERFGSRPPRIASLAYDSVILAAGLLSRSPQDPYSTSNLTNPNGFIGIDGIFRFTDGGKAERGVVIYQTNGTGSPVVAKAAPGRF